VKKIKTSRRSKRVDSTPTQAEARGFDREIERTRQNRALMKFLTARARQTETLSFEDARHRLGL
jgi:hypothetical protein